MHVQRASVLVSRRWDVAQRILSPAEPAPHIKADFGLDSIHKHAGYHL